MLYKNGILPKEVLIEIASCLPCSALINFRLVCKRFNEICSSHVFWNKKYQKDFKDFRNNIFSNDVFEDYEMSTRDIERIYIETIRNREFWKAYKDHNEGAFLCEEWIDCNLFQEKRVVFHFLKEKILFNYISYNYIKATFQNDKYDYALTNHTEISEKELDIFMGILKEIRDLFSYNQMERYIFNGMIQGVIPLTVNNQDLPNYTFYQGIILLKKV